MLHSIHGRGDVQLSVGVAQATPLAASGPAWQPNPAGSDRQHVAVFTGVPFPEVLSEGNFS
jgi:hypothetical protein